MSTAEKIKLSSSPVPQSKSPNPLNYKTNSYFGNEINQESNEQFATTQYGNAWGSGIDLGNLAEINKS